MKTKEMIDKLENLKEIIEFTISNIKRKEEIKKLNKKKNSEKYEDVESAEIDLKLVSKFINFLQEQS